jgi:hypothetical protein
MARRSLATRPLAVSQTGAVHGERSLARSLSMSKIHQPPPQQQQPQPQPPPPTQHEPHEPR